MRLTNNKRACVPADWTANDVIYEEWRSGGGGSDHERPRTAREAAWADAFTTCSELYTAANRPQPELRCRKGMSVKPSRAGWEGPIHGCMGTRDRREWHRWRRAVIPCSRLFCR